jgi:hypothetical protein
MSHDHKALALGGYHLEDVRVSESLTGDCQTKQSRAPVTASTHAEPQAAEMVMASKQASTYFQISHKASLTSEKGEFLDDASSAVLVTQVAHPILVPRPRHEHRCNPVKIRNHRGTARQSIALIHVRPDLSDEG